MIMVVDIKYEVWVVVWEGIAIVIWEVEMEEVTLWGRVTPGDEEMLWKEDSIEEICIVVALRNDDGDTIIILSFIGDDTDLNEGICKGVFKTRHATDEGIGISIGTCVIDSGNIVAFW